MRKAFKHLILLFAFLLACLDTNVAYAKSGVKLRGQEKANKWFIKKVKGWFGYGKKKSTRKKMPTRKKMSTRKEEQIHETNGRINKKFVLTSAGGGSRAFFGLAAFIEGYKNGGGA